MKQLYSLLYALLFIIGAATAQSGNTCVEAKELLQIPDSCAVNEHQLNAGQHEQWHKIIPNQPELIIKVEKLQNSQLQEADIKKISLYKGGCGGLQLIEKKDISLNESLEITRNDIAVNEEHFIKLERDPGQGEAFYGLCVQKKSALSPCILVNGEDCTPDFSSDYCYEELNYNTVNICVGDMVSFQQCDKNSDYNGTFTWYFNGSNFTSPVQENLQGPHIIRIPQWNTAGTYFVQGIFKPSSCPSNSPGAKFIVQINVSAMPAVSFTLPPDPVCVGEACFQQSFDINEIQYETWNFGDGSSQNYFNPIPSVVCHNFENPGEYNVTLTAVSSACTVSVNQTVTVTGSLPLFDTWVYYIPNIIPVQIWEPGNNPFNNTTGPVNLQGIIVKPKTTLTIKNMVINFDPYAKVLVEGHDDYWGIGTLILDNTTLNVNEECNPGAMWQGVEVSGYGGGGSNPDNAKAGVLKMKNNAVIKNAVNAVKTFAYVNYGIGTDFHNGIVQAENSKFINNSRDAAFTTYVGVPNTSYFKNCDFITDGALKDPSVALQPHVTMDGVTGVTFAGCRFKNNTPQLYPGGQWGSGVGIHSIDASYRVTRLCNGFSVIQDKQGNLISVCNNSTNSHFENLFAGVYATASNPMYAYSVLYSDFINDFVGIANFGSNNSLIVNNKFETSFAGLYLSGATGYTVENNRFLPSSLASPFLGGPYGAIVANSGTNTDKIYKNSFSSNSGKELNVGLQAQGTNSNLLLRCNTFNNNSTIATDIGIASGTIKDDQGGCVLGSDPPADNQFSYTATQDFWANTGVNGTNNITYAHSQDQGGTYHLAPRVGYYNANNTLVAPCPLLNYDPNQTCSTTVFQGRIAHDNGMNEHRTKADSLRSFIDGCNTDDLLNYIKTVMSPVQVEKRLKPHYPYLSDEVLKEAINRQPPLPANTIEKVLLANAPLTDEVMAEAVNRQPALPVSTMNKINAAQTGISPRRELEKQIDAYETLRDEHKKAILHSFLHDTTEISENDSLFGFVAQWDSVAAFLEREKITNPCAKTREDKNRERDNQRKLISTHIARRDFTKAQQEIAELQVKEGSNCDYCKLSSRLITLEQSPENKYKLKTDMAAKAEVEQIANSGTKQQEETNARALLAFVFEDSLPFIAEPLIFGTQQRLGHIEENPENLPAEAQSEQAVQLVVYPNPASNLLTVEYQNADYGKYLFRIEDISGRVILDEWQVTNSKNEIKISDINSGIYFYSIVVNNNTIARNKIIISKE